jgi:hypothetical protein
VVNPFPILEINHPTMGQILKNKKFLIPDFKSFSLLARLMPIRRQTTNNKTQTKQIKKINQTKN